MLALLGGSNVFALHRLASNQATFKIKFGSIPHSLWHYWDRVVCTEGEDENCQHDHRIGDAKDDTASSWDVRSLGIRLL